MRARVDEALKIQLPSDVVDRLKLKPGDEIALELGADGRYDLVRAEDLGSVQRGEDPWSIFDLGTGETAQLDFDIPELIRRSREERTDAILGGGYSK